MGKKIILLFAFLLIFATQVFSANLVMVGWDGAGLNNVKPLLDAGKLPNLQKFIDDGACIFHIELIAKTETVTSWTQVWTGLTYDCTGVLNNHHWAFLPYRKTIVKAIQEKGHEIGWFTSKGFLWDYSPIKCIKDNANHRMKTFPESGDNNYIYKLTDQAIQFVSTHDNFFMFLHFNPDIYGHRHGENSDRYLYEFERADEQFGRLMEYVNPETTKVIVVSDHGFDEGKFTHHNAPDAFMATNLLVKDIYCNGETTPTIRDIANTVLDFYGIPSVDRMRGKSLLK